ncbi:MAG: nitroreductase family protein, partial [Peptococcaceae bacterium]|nr:nitroreductase family protein [Peptococcaceae bacterium]
MREQELLKIIRERKTCRAPFDEDCPIDPSVLRQILDAAACAPTAHNIQNFKIVVVDDRSILLELSELESQVSSLFIQENYRYVSLTEDE